MDSRSRESVWSNKSCKGKPTACVNAIPVRIRAATSNCSKLSCSIWARRLRSRCSVCVNSTARARKSWDGWVESVLSASLCLVLSLSALNWISAASMFLRFVTSTNNRDIPPRQGNSRSSSQMRRDGKKNSNVSGIRSVADIVRRCCIAGDCASGNASQNAFPSSSPGVNRV